MTISDLEGPKGFLEAILDEPAGRTESPHAAVVFAHPHPELGGTMHTKAVYQGSKGLTRIGCAVLRFNFRGVGRSAGTFDQGEGEKDDFRAALDYMARRYPGTRLWSAGFSFGAWVALEVGAVDDRVEALIGIAPPVATSASGMDYTFPNTLETTKPKFFVQGEADEVCPVQGMWAFYGRLEEPKELVLIDAADHLFEGKTPEVGEALEDLLGGF
ncbi:MAG: alpha/beta fold hydrolase [Acidobacteria bacterium]|nr:alpha/beta fold hydrolase [Acidobacteriota bacterium]